MVSIPTVWPLRSKGLELDRPRIMAILNLTPDSFSDGGLHVELAAALKRVDAIREEGADLIDIGAESTRPGAAPVEPEEEWRRLEPLLKALSPNFDLPISIDTRHAEVARKALDLGAEILNDVSSAKDPELLKAVADARCGYVLMHSRGEPATMKALASYEDLIPDISRELSEGLLRCSAAGISADRIAVDPGFGFAKDLAQNWELLVRLEEFRSFGRPLLIGLSRKRMIRECVGEDPQILAAASATAAGLAAQRGARILRVHDVAHTRAVLQVLHRGGLLP